MLAPVEALVAYARSEKNTRWPLVCEEPILKAINTWVAIREGDRDTLKRVAKWQHPTPYRVDSLGAFIADAWAAYLIGDEPVVEAANAADEASMDSLLEVNEFASELERAVGLCVSEGEIWSRIYVDEYAGRPLLDWVSRANILPLWLGPRLAAAAVVTELRGKAGTAKGTIWRHLEIHAPGVVANRLFSGRADRLGLEVDLRAHPATAALQPEWETAIKGLLVRRIPNKLRKDRRIGLSDYAPILDQLLDLNEASMIGAHNARLTARKRAIVSGNALRTPSRDDGLLEPEENQGASPPRAKFDPAEEIFVQDALDGELGRDGKDPFRILEYSFDAEALIAYKRDLVETAITRIGLTPQYLGVSGSLGEGYAISGTALRLRLIPTDNAGRSKARYLDDAIPTILSTMAQLDKAQPALGFGANWTQPEGLPTFKRSPGLPVDEVEQAQRHQALLAAGAESVETAVKELHPEWDDTQVGDEVKRIREDKAAGGGSMFGA